MYKTAIRHVSCSIGPSLTRLRNNYPKHEHSKTRILMESCSTIKDRKNKNIRDKLEIAPEEDKMREKLLRCLVMYKGDL